MPIHKDSTFGKERVVGIESYRQLPIILTPLSDEPGFPDEFLASNPYYHSVRKGCSIQNVRSSYNRTLMLYTKQKCLTHKVVVGRAGWELGMYGGTVSPNYKW